MLAKDGLLNAIEVVELAKDIERYINKNGSKVTTIYYTAKSIAKYDKEKVKDANYYKKRLQLVKTRTRAPSVGSRVKMVTLLRLFKGWEDTEFAKSIKKAIYCIESHNKLAEKELTQIKKVQTKKKEENLKEFSQTLKSVKSLLTSAGIGAKSMRESISIAGKTLVVKIPSGGYISISRSDSDKFDKAEK